MRPGIIWAGTPGDPVTDALIICNNHIMSGTVCVRLENFYQILYDS